MGNQQIDWPGYFAWSSDPRWLRRCTARALELPSNPRGIDAGKVTDRMEITKRSQLRNHINKRVHTQHVYVSMAARITCSQVRIEDGLKRAVAEAFQGWESRYAYGCAVKRHRSTSFVQILT